MDYTKAGAIGAGTGAGVLPVTGMSIIGYIILSAALMAAGFALYRFLPKRAKI